VIGAICCRMELLVQGQYLASNSKGAQYISLVMPAAVQQAHSQLQQEQQQQQHQQDEQQQREGQRSSSGASHGSATSEDGHGAPHTADSAAGGNGGGGGSGEEPLYRLYIMTLGVLAAYRYVIFSAELYLISCTL
jgi:hypothetical protein